MIYIKGKFCIFYWFTSVGQKNTCQTSRALNHFSSNFGEKYDVCGVNFIIKGCLPGVHPVFSLLLKLGRRHIIDTLTLSRKSPDHLFEHCTVDRGRCPLLFLSLGGGVGITPAK